MEQLVDNVPELKIELQSLLLQGQLSREQIDKLKSLLVQIMEQSNPRTGLRGLEAKLMGQCLEVVATFSQKEMKAFFATMGPENFCMFYYMQRGLHKQNCFFVFNPRHYAGIRKHIGGCVGEHVKSGPAMFDTSVISLPRLSVELKLRTQMVTFDIQTILFQCISIERALDPDKKRVCRVPFNVETAQFLVECCGAEVDRRGFDGFSSFIEKAVYVLDDEWSSLNALIFYVKQSKKSRDELVAMIRGFEEKAYGVEAKLRWVLASQIVAGAMPDEETWSAMYVAVAEPIRAAAKIAADEKQAAKIAEAEREVPEAEKQGVAELLQKYKDDGSFENQKKIEARLAELSPAGKKYLVELARTIVDGKYAANIQRYIDAQSGNTKRLRK